MLSQLSISPLICEILHVNIVDHSAQVSLRPRRKLYSLHLLGILCLAQCLRDRLWIFEANKAIASRSVVLIQRDLA